MRVYLYISTWAVAGPLARLPGVAAVVSGEPCGVDDAGWGPAGLSLDQRPALHRHGRSGMDLPRHPLSGDLEGRNGIGVGVGELAGSPSRDRGGGSHPRRESTLAHRERGI